MPPKTTVAIRRAPPIGPPPIEEVTISEHAETYRVSHSIYACGGEFLLYLDRDGSDGVQLSREAVVALRDLCNQVLGDN